MDLHRLSLVVENINLSYDQDFTISLRLCGSDWCSAGTFHQSILPAGVTCTFTPTEESLGLSELPVDMKVEVSSSVFSGTLAIAKNVGKAEFHARGTTGLFLEGGTQEILLLSILVAAEEIRSPAPPQLVNIHCQTDSIRVSEAGSQVVGPPVKHQSAETQARVIEPHELEKVVIRALQHNFPQKQRHQTEKKSPHPPDPTPPSNNLGWNVVPRLQKLTVLDKMINNRQKLLGSMDATVQHSEVRKKMEFIKSQRRPKSEETLSVQTISQPEKREKKMTPVFKKVTVAEKKKTKSKKEQRKKKLEEEEEEEVTESSSETSESESTQEKEDPTEDSGTTDESDSTTMDSGSVSDSEPSSSNGSSVKIVQLPPKRPLQASLSNTSIEDPFSPRPARSKPHSVKINPIPVESSLSPTSQYIKDLREQILRERMSKL